MKNLHLITNERLIHTIHIADADFGADRYLYEKAVEKLAVEGEGPDNTLIICDGDNMLLEYIEFEGPNYEPPIAEKELQEDEIDGYMMFGIAIALLLAYMIIT
jgi:hypothetical protein